MLLSYVYGSMKWPTTTAITINIRWKHQITLSSNLALACAHKGSSTRTGKVGSTTITPGGNTLFQLDRPLVLCSCHIFHLPSFTKRNNQTSWSFNNTTIIAKLSSSILASFESRNQCSCGSNTSTAKRLFPAAYKDSDWSFGSDVCSILLKIPLTLSIRLNILMRF